MNKPILIAGYGSVGRRHFHNLRALGERDFIFLRSRNGVIADDEIFSFPQTISLVEALSYRPRIAVIANPTSLHMEVAIAAAEAGLRSLY